MQWDHIKSSFLAAFLHPESIDRARSELITLKQVEGESVNMYYLRMQWIMKRWPDHGLPDGLLKGIFVDGLREGFQDWIVPQRPDTLEEAVRLARNWEQVQSMRATRRSKEGGEESPNKNASGSNMITTSSKCGFCDGGGHEERECEVKRMMRELWLKRRALNSKELQQQQDEERGGCTSGEVGVKKIGELGRLVSLARRGQCQCLKHQCWKKYERSCSAVSDNRVNGSSPAANQQ